MKQPNLLNLIKTFIVCALLTWALPARAETINLSTYYPAPYGAYDYLRLFPRPTQPPCQIGTLYVDSGSTLFFCSIGGPTGPVFIPLTGVWTKSGNNIYPLDYANPNLKVGIGTNIPAALLHLNGGALRIQATGTWEVQAAAAGFTIFNVNNPSAQLLINAAGNVGIGTTPATKLDINGQITVRGGVPVGGIKRGMVLISPADGNPTPSWGYAVYAP